MGGFGKSTPIKAEVGVQYTKYGKEMILSTPNDKDAPCACNSGNPYSACCKPAHDSGSYAELTASQVLRARFSAACYGLVNFIVDTTHPDMKDYAAPEEVLSKHGRSKRDIWAKDINTALGQQELSDLLINSEDVEGDRVIFSVSLDRSIRGQKSNVDKSIEQKVHFKKGPAGEWLHLLSADVIDGEEVSEVVKEKINKQKAVIINRQYSLLGNRDKARTEGRKVNFTVR